MQLERLTHPAGLNKLVANEHPRTWRDKCTCGGPSLSFTQGVKLLGLTLARAEDAGLVWLRQNLRQWGTAVYRKLTFAKVHVVRRREERASAVKLGAVHMGVALDQP